MQLSDVLRILISSVAKCSMALRPTALSSKVHTLALKFWPWLHHWF